MEFELIQNLDITVKDNIQYHRLMLTQSGTVATFYSDDADECYYLDWYTGSEVVQTKIQDFTYDVFDPPALFQCQGYVGIFASAGNALCLFTENRKNEPIRISISNELPVIQYPGFDKELTNYVYAGSTDSDVIPFLLKEGGLLPVYFAQLKIDVAEGSAKWIKLNYWGDSQEITAYMAVLEKPAKKPFTILHALNKNDWTYIFGIGDRDGGYLKYGMDYSDLCLLDEGGKVKEKIFSLGPLNKGGKKGGKECLFTSSGHYAILTPVFNADDWKGQQRILDIGQQQLLDVQLPKTLAGYQIVDHNNDCFLLINGMRNQIITDISGIIIAKSLS
ncbi:hypothetical protein [Pedobacter africanus]|uniref:TolB-like 6-blade propeller-like n=1 Tax=Pedobacter africanus TaxID=151894 RepID=A0A1W2E9U3_9SPHI|nr:hypothetical protein [Pedobacter africanus]SMD06307.1 hypothetical protein SAMN04488524_4588 [Pedobacter africanus]